MRWGQELAGKKHQGAVHIDSVALYPDWGMGYSMFLSELSKGYL